MTTMVKRALDRMLHPRPMPTQETINPAPTRDLVLEAICSVRGEYTNQAEDGKLWMGPGDLEFECFDAPAAADAVMKIEPFAEITRLRARIAELERERDGLLDLIL